MTTEEVKVRFKSFARKKDGSPITKKVKPKGLGKGPRMALIKKLRKILPK